MLTILFAALAAVSPVVLPQDPARRPVATWILQVEGDAVALQVRGATAKPFEYRAPRAATSGYRISLRDRRGKLLVAVPLDLTPFCMDPAHRGDVPHVHGDVLVAHRVVCTVKIPARADIAQLRIERVRKGRPPVVLGTLDRADLEVLVQRDRREERR